MITQVRSASAARGQANAAREWAIKITNYLNDQFPGSSIDVITNVSGELRRVHWVVEHESMAAYEEWNNMVIADAEYQELVAESTAAQLFENDLTESLYRSLL